MGAQRGGLGADPAEGSADALEGFTRGLRDEAPPLARIDALDVTSADPDGAPDFRVLDSDLAPVGRLPVSPDVALCAACAAELHDPADRRYRYPFITCTDCGPRFTVIESMPYDRERSTMRAFAQCPDCLAEYGDPADRRYHSETNSCPVCGPRVWLEAEGQTTLHDDMALRAAGDLLLRGRILAVRGLGGFHLACDAADDMAVHRLRARKHRDAKPLAIMVRTIEEARGLAHVSDAEEALLTSRARPLVVLTRREGAALALALAPGLTTVAVMLAYTPLHVLLLEEVGCALVMTSGNESDEPIATGNDEARARLAGIADAFLLHDREIVARYDDSLLRLTRHGPLFLRRARGYAPLPVALPVPARLPFLAVGPHLKNTLTLAGDDQAWVSQHVGDLENLETLEHFQEVRRRFETLFRVAPRAVVRDLHPAYLSTRVAEESGLEELPPVQHHHAHIAAVQGEHGITARRPRPRLRRDRLRRGRPRLGGGVPPLGTCGASDDSAICATPPCPAATRQPAPRGAWLPGTCRWSPTKPRRSLAAFEDVDLMERAAARRQIERRINAPEASSMGRLFDAAAAVLGVRTVARYEGQAPMELESLAGSTRGALLPFPAVQDDDGMWILEPLPLLIALGEGRVSGRPLAELAAAFHESVAEASAALAARLCEAESLDTVALGGGCFQNARLLDGVAGRLEAAGLRVLLPRLLGPNDGAVSYGQAVVAAARMGE